MFELFLAKLNTLLGGQDTFNDVIGNNKHDDGQLTVNVIASSASLPVEHKQEMLKALLDIDAEAVNTSRECDGNTPLHVAVEQANLNAIKLLIEFQADAFVKNKNGESPLCSVAIKQTHLLPDIMRILGMSETVRHLCQELTDHQQKQVALYLTENGKDLADELIRHGNSSSSRTNDTETSAQGEQRDMKNDGDISRLDGLDSLSWPLHHCVQKRDYQKLAQLIADGRARKVQNRMFNPCITSSQNHRQVPLSQCITRIHSKVLYSRDSVTATGNKCA